MHNSEHGFKRHINPLPKLSLGNLCLKNLDLSKLYDADVPMKKIK